MKRGIRSKVINKWLRWERVFYAPRWRPLLWWPPTRSLLKVGSRRAHIVVYRKGWATRA
jgi:hypothetical protein